MNEDYEDYYDDEAVASSLAAISTASYFVRFPTIVLRTGLGI